MCLGAFQTVIRDWLFFVFESEIVEFRTLDERHTQT